MKRVSEKKPVIAIIGGTGKEGPGLAMRWAQAGYSVIIGSRQQEKARHTAEMINEKLGLDTVRGEVNAEAVKACNIAVLTVVQSAHQAALESIKAVFDGQILVDATARVDFRNPKPPEPPAAARKAQNILGDKAVVVGAFQNVPAHALKKHLDKPLDAHVLVCSDDKKAAEAVIRLATDGGMQAYYAGCLDNAIIAEGMTAVLISMNKYYGVKTASVRIAGLEQA